MSETVDLCVVGAGLCGLSVALRAKAAGRSVAVVEAAPRAGGVIKTERVGPYRVERGAATFPSTAAGVLELAALCPSPPTIVTPPPEAERQFLWTPSGLVPVVRRPGALVLSGLLSPFAAARAALEPFLGRRRGAAPESAHAFVRRRFGRSIADRFLAPMTLGIHGSDARDLGAADAFPALAEMEREHGSVLKALFKRAGTGARRVRTFEGGMESFPRAMAEALGNALSLATSARAVRADGDGVEVEVASGRRIRAREVVFATTAREQAALVAPHSAEAAEILLAVRYVPMVVTAVGIPPGGSPPIPKAFGFLRGAGVKARILGASFPSVVDPSCAPEGHALLTVYLGGGRDPDALALDDGRVAAQVEHDLSRALRGPVRPDMISVHRLERAIPVLAPGHRARMARAQALLAPLRIRLSGSHITGVGVAACTEPEQSTTIVRPSVM
jgi:oxygen-dependent protoporphyrinogen oxidase